MHEILFTETAKGQYDKLSPRLQVQVDKALQRVARYPEKGKPLRGELRGIWSERVATFRILYKISRHTVEILILVIEHRRTVYGGH